MKHRPGPICLLLLALAPASGLLAVDSDSLTDATVEEAREAIIEMIWSHQDPDRHWDPVKMPELQQPLVKPDRLSCSVDCQTNHHPRSA